MNYIAILDYDHLDNALFLKSFSEALAAQYGTRGIILHGDSQYTDRLIQTGMMSDDARQRSIKDLNHRLVSLMVDSGVPVVGMNAYQRGMIRYDGSALQLDSNLLSRLPNRTHLLMSNLVEDKHTRKPFAYNLAELATNLYRELAMDEIFIFSKNEADEVITTNNFKPEEMAFEDLGKGFIERSLPDDLQDLMISFRLTTTQSFRTLPKTKNTVLITHR